MAEKKVPRIDGAESGRFAQERLAEGTETEPRTVDEAQRRLHELEIRQVELEMQNAELRQASDKLETALKQYAALYDFAPVSYFTLDRMGTISGVNFTGAGLVGVERSRLIGRRFGLLVSDEARPAFADFLGKVFTSPAKEVCEVALLNEGNPPLWLQVEGVSAPSGQECRIALIDITRFKLAGEVFRKEKEAAEEAHRLKTEAAEMSALAKNLFLANMSHELRTPMTGTLGMLQLALEEEIAPVPRGYLEATLCSALSLLRILNDFIDMAKIEAGKLTLEEEPFSLQMCISEVVDIITPKLHRKGLDFAIEIADEMPDAVLGDQVRLRQVLINLIGNAVKFTDGGKVVLRLSAGRATSNGERELTISVIDTGIGIPDDKKGLLFQAFSQVDSSHSRSFEGPGLGLAICREIVELMGGTITFVSEEGVGSTFFFTIPLVEAGLASDALFAAEPQSTETVSPAPEGERVRRILLAEDDATTSEVLGLMLKRSNYQVDFAENGLQAIGMWEKGGYDLVLMDVQMPHFNGFEATRVIREKELERGGHVPIVAMTAHALKEDEDRCIAAGMDGYISKPIDLKKALQVIGESL